MRLFYQLAQGGHEFSEDTAARVADLERRREENKVRNQKFIPALGMTGADALRTLTPGAYLAAPAKGISPIPPINPKREYPPDTSWFRNTKDGYFIWVGELQGRRTIEMFPISSNENFWRDITWHLQRGRELYAAVDDFDKQTDEIMRKLLGAFAQVLSSAPGSYPRADRFDSNVISGLGFRQRAVNDTAKNEPSFSSVISHISPSEAANTSFAVVGFVTQKIYLEDSDDPENPELQTIGDKISNDLGRLFRQIPDAKFDRQLRTGEMGEAIVQETLRRRGYEVFALQNESSHGVDLIAYKEGIGSKGLLIFVEVKASQRDVAPSLSEPQKNPHSFIKSRLESAASGEGAWKNVPPHIREVAKALLGELESGRPISGLRIKVTKLRNGVQFKIQFKRWKLPTARVINRRPKSRR
jgi:hypothetical protein